MIIIYFKKISNRLVFLNIAAILITMKLNPGKKNDYIHR